MSNQNPIEIQKNNEYSPELEKLYRKYTSLADIELIKGNGDENNSTESNLQCIIIDQKSSKQVIDVDAGPLSDMPSSLKDIMELGNSVDFFNKDSNPRGILLPQEASKYTKTVRRSYDNASNLKQREPQKIIC